MRTALLSKRTPGSSREVLNSEVWGSLKALGVTGGQLQRWVETSISIGIGYRNEQRKHPPKIMPKSTNLKALLATPFLWRESQIPWPPFMHQRQPQASS